MEYIVFDLEWNQGGNEEHEREKLCFEIVEIGAVKMNEKGVMISEFSRLVKPQVYHEMHKITSRLIHLQMQELEHGSPFEEVAEQFLDWCGTDYIFCTWGPLDLTELQRNMQYYGMEALAKGPLAFLDIQKLFSLAYEDGKSRKSLEYAVDFLGLEKDIPFHRAFSDAYYAGKVLARIPEKFYGNCSYDLFHLPAERADEVHVVFDGYEKYISRVFPNKAAALTDREVISSKCYLCHKNLKKKIRWFTPNGKHYYCVAYCDCHGYMKGKIRIRRAEGDCVYVVKTTKFISPSDAEDISLRRNRAKKRKDQ